MTARAFHPHQRYFAGEKARDVFVKSKLPVDKLSQIWYVALWKALAVYANTCV